MSKRARHGIIAMTGPGLALQELMYGFIMELIFVTAARIGMLDYGSTLDLVILITGMNVTWGAIDAVVFYLIDSFSARQHRHMIDHGKRGPAEREEAVEYLLEEFGGTPLDSLDPEEERRVCESIVDKRVESEAEVRDDRRSMAISSLGCFIITFLTIVPVIVPLLLIEPVETALGVASALSSTIMFFVGYKMKDYFSVNGWVMGLFLTGVSWTLTIIATFTGGRRWTERSRHP